MAHHLNILLGREKLGGSRLVFGKTCHLFPPCSLRLVPADAAGIPCASTGLCLAAQTGSTGNLSRGVDKKKKRPRRTRPWARGGRAAGGAAAPRDARPGAGPRSIPGSVRVWHRAAAAWVGCGAAATERPKAAFKIQKEVLGSEWKIEVL